LRRLALIAFAAALGGCGASTERGPGPVVVTTTRDFGEQPVTRIARVSGGEAAAKVAPGGGSVFVNGTAVDPANAKVYGGDRVWVDRHGSAFRVPAVVGSFPEPFRSGSGGKRFPVRIECARVGGAACRTARDRLVAAGVGTAAIAGTGGTAGQEVLRVVVGPWRAIRADPALAQLDAGPRISGVFARPAPDAGSIALLGPAGETVRTLRLGDGLVAATRVGDQQPTWAVTGVDDAGSLAAARALSARVLRDRFAAATVPRGVVSVP
jgi:hypothetical protein